jgi:hypothetical protein
MARRSNRTARRTPASSGAPTIPVDEVAIDTGSALVERDPDHPDRVTLHVNGVPSSSIDLVDPGFLAFEYMQQMAAVIALMPAGSLRVLHLGAAGCALARHVEHERPDSRQLGVDVDARLLQLVREWFALPRAPRLRLRADDAGHALASLAPGSFDVVVRDVFAGNRTPDHLAGTAFATGAHRVLRPGGLLLANCADRPPLVQARREVATLASVFGADAARTGRLAAIAEPAVVKGRRYGNVVLAAVRGGDASSGSGTDEYGNREDGLDLRDPALGRALRTLAVPAQPITGAELERFAASAAPLP